MFKCHPTHCNRSVQLWPLREIGPFICVIEMRICLSTSNPAGEVIWVTYADIPKKPIS